jgi:signal transduction histidine kinase/HAMP domain-containing protein
LFGKRSIGARIFGAFVLMSAIIGLVGLAGYGVLSSAGQIAITTFDRPLMAISYARAAHNRFAQMQLAELRHEQAATPEQRTVLAAQISELMEDFESDLEVAAERSTHADEQGVIRQIGPLVSRWRDLRAQGALAALPPLEAQINDAFDLLIEFNTGNSFVGRRQAVTYIENYKYAVGGVTLLALLLAGAITWHLRSRIVRPLSAAAAVADRIAAGELQTEIPQGGRDETGALLKSMTVMQDSIRDMMARETAMRLSAENRLTDALETSNEGVMLVTPQGNIALANSSLRRFFPGLEDTLVAGTPFEQALGAIQGQLAPGPLEAADMTGHAELQLACGRWLRLTGTATSEGGTIIFFSDFTIIKEREEALRKAMQQAEAANAAKTRFLANMSHELRTPLNAIIGFSEIITGELFGKLGNDKYLDYSRDVLRSGRHLLSVINDVLDLVKSESGRMTFRVQDVDMREVLQDCAAIMREQCAAAGLSLSLEGVAGPLPVMGDPAKLRQIFLNLLSNAAKFTARGGAVSLAVVESADMVAVTVSDTGIGMSPEDIEVAFQPFGQVDNRLERRYEGTGLGLPLTRALAELHRATVTITSQAGAGTQVCVTFPKNLPVELDVAI